MKHEYVLKITNNNFYKEVQLSELQQKIRIGTGIDCNVRFYKELFFESFYVELIHNEDIWQIICSDNVYVSLGDVRKLVTKELEHGDTFSIRYMSSDIELLKCDFLFDFDNEEKEYDRIIDLRDTNTLTIGNSQESDIVLISEYIENDRLLLERCEEGFRLLAQDTRYGVYHNGRIADPGTVVRDKDFISMADCSFYYVNGTLRTNKNVQVKGLTYYDQPQKNAYPKFNRNTRIKQIVDDEKIDVMDPPAIPQKPKNNIFTRLLPSMVMVATAIIMGVVMGRGMIIFSIISGLMGVVTGVISIVEGNKEFKKKTEERIEKYNAYITNKREEIEAFRQTEKRVLEEVYIDQQEELERFDTFSPDLFDRDRDDEDFLIVRLGTGNQEARKKVEYKKQERLEVEDELQEMPQRICEEYRLIGDAPVTCNIKEINALGITGDPAHRFGLMKNIVIDLCARQYHSDVKMVFIAEQEHEDKIKWLRLLPHTYNTYVDMWNIAYNDDSKNNVFEYLYKELTVREQNKTFEENIIVFLYDEFGFKNHPVSKFVKTAKELGATFVFFADHKSDIPVGCEYIINIQDERSAVLIDAADKKNSIDFAYDAISDAQAADIAKLLAPVYTEEISLEGTLTKNISLFQLLNIIAVDDIDLATNWRVSQADKSMSAPIGVTKNNIISLDLHDKAHGPHGLVAGTTGSGKSEILQTYILSMSLLYHPHEVGFLIIDFKGGGMVNQFRELPHLLGAITNIDGKEINRSLKSIKAELQKRQRLFAEADVNHIDKYIKKYKAGEIKAPLPHLIIIVDEFAELKAEQPDFMKELISASRIGRSLGVHLILATQKPSGQVSEQIWSNSRFKLCLKVQSQEDSNEVIKSPLAAEIKEAGRAYLQVGNDEIFELFQSAYSGAPEKEDSSNVKEFTIFQFDDSGRKAPVYTQKKEKSDVARTTQLDAIVKHVKEYCEKNGLVKLPDICLPSLEETIEFPDRSKLTTGENTVIVETGIYDDPDNQYQGVFSLDLTNANTMIIGSAQSGKTNIFQTIIRNLASKYSPKEVNIYIIDFASMVLKNFEKLSHVGGVVTPTDDEKLKNLMKLLHSEISFRREKLLQTGVSSFEAYKDAGKMDLPQIVLMIDNLTALKELYYQDDDELLSLCREGLTVGVSVIIANSQTAGIGYKYLSNFANRIAFFCNDSSEYNSLFDHCSERINDIKGRCIVEVDKTHLECQTFLSFNGEKEIDRTMEIKRFISIINDKNAEQKAKRIPVIPNILTFDDVQNDLLSYTTDKYELVVGLDYATVEPFVLNLSALSSPLVISGRTGMGRHNFICYAVKLMDCVYRDMTEVYIFDGIQRKLNVLRGMSNVEEYNTFSNNFEHVIAHIESTLKKRYERIMAEDSDFEDEKLIVLIINDKEVLEFISNNLSVYDTYRNITGKYKNMNVCVIIGDYENTNVSYMSPELIKNLRDNKHFLFFDDIADMKILDVPLSVVREYKKPISTGDSYYIKENEVIKIKTARN